MEQYFINCENKPYYEVVKKLIRLNPYFANYKIQQTTKDLINAIMNGNNNYVASNGNQGGTKANKFILMFTTKLNGKIGIAIKIVYYRYGRPNVKLNEKFEIREV